MRTDDRSSPPKRIAKAERAANILALALVASALAACAHWLG